MFRFSHCLWLLLAFAATAGAQEQGAAPPAADESPLTLFNPTPAEDLRPLATDGPWATESPYTVDAGHVQIEATLLNYVRGHISTDGATERFEEWALLPFTLKLGLLDRLDAQLLLEPYNLVYTDQAGRRTSQSGFGDTTFRLKLNLWGNDEGQTGLGVIPFVKFPTSQDGLGNDSVEGGVILPFAAELPWGFELGLTSRFDAARDETGNGYHPEFGNSIRLDHALAGTLGGYLEFASSVSTERGSEWVGTVDPGLYYLLTENLELNAGVAIGVTRGANDWEAFVGVAWRH